MTDAILLALAFASDVIIDNTPLLCFMAGALAITIGIIAIPLEPAPKKGGGRGFV